MLTRFRARVGTIAMVAMVAAFSALPAFATPATVESTTSGAFDDVEAFITGTALPALLGLAVVVTIGMVGYRWIKKARGA